jgi:soluble lytic murein transglycosylase
VLLFLSSTIFAKDLTYQSILAMPKSYAKDFYIYQILKKGVTKPQANTLLKQVKKLSPKIYKRFVPYIDDFKRKAYCQSLKGKQLLGRYGDCIRDGLSLYRATKLDPNLLYKIASSIHSFDPMLELEYKTISTKSFNTLTKLPPKILLKTFNNVGSKFRKKFYNQPFSKSLLSQLVKTEGFDLAIEKIIRGDLQNIQKSLVEIDSSSLNAESNFLLGLNAIKFGQLEYALGYFDLSSKKAKFTFEKDKALFWKYQLTKDSSILDLLIDSHEINIYTLRAYELKGEFPTNIIYSIDPKTTNIPFDIKDPFAWLAFKEKIKSTNFGSFEQKRAYLMHYNTKDSEPHIARLLYRYKDKIRFYITPYSQYLSNTDAQRKALIYSLARQESHFIPTDVSYSYALGMMQFMPFVADGIAKKIGWSSFQYEDMFDPKTAYKFANIHLDYLEKSLNHPLFIAYAYNGGLGFTNRKILSKNYFKQGAYEPFWSMEMIPNAQARKYGKRVLANYVIYSRLLGVGESLDSLLKRLQN